MGIFDKVTDTVLRVGTLGLSDKAGLTGSGANVQAAPLAYTAEQSDLIKKLQARANGEVPSIAEAQTKKNMADVLSNQVAAIRSTPGLNPALQARLANQAGQQASTDVAQQGTIAKLAEQQEAESALGAQISGAQAAAMGIDKMNIDSSNAKANRWTNLIGGAGTAAAAASDERGKENIESSNGKAIDLIEHLKGKLYEYKDDSNGPGLHIGIMAQDLEKTPLGRSMVFEENGMKKVDYGKGFGAVLAAMTEINDKLKDLESKRSK